MIEWVRCPHCQLQHTVRPDGRCPRCRAGSSASAPGGGEPLPTIPVAPSAAPRPRVWTVLVAFLASQGATVLVGIVVVLAAAAQAAARRGGRLSPAEVRQLAEDPALLLVLLGLGAVGTGAVALVAGSLGREPLRARVMLGAARSAKVATAVACAGGLGLALAFDALTSALALRPGAPLRLLNRVLEAGAGGGERGPTLFVLGLVSVAVLAPVGEELLYRGYMQRRLVQRWGPVAGVVATAALFGIAHVDRLQSPFAAALGLLLGWVAVRSGSIVPAMLGHAAVNGWGVVATRLHLSPQSAGTSAAAGLLGLGLLAGAVVLGRARLGAAGRSGPGAPGGPDAVPPP